MTYTSWYAPEIALNKGPWKFNGLPGLILKVEDSKGDYMIRNFSVFFLSR